MKRIILILLLVLFTKTLNLFSQEKPRVEVYLITCGPGTETYSIYGHSALRIVIPEKKTDMVYNWGLFDFDTKNFAWKFAKGRLDYMLGVEPLQNFLQGYFYEKRYVYSQKINLEPPEIEKLLLLITDNLKQENIKYRYDFFFDDCSTRIRDLIEKSVGEKLLYPPVEKGKFQTFREMVGKYQNPYPWLQFGVDLIMGSSSDKKTEFRERMFLPIDLKDELSETVINRNGKMIPLLRNPEKILDFDSPVVKRKLLVSPVFVFTLVLIIVIILPLWLNNRKINNFVDFFIFSVYSILALLMIFFNFFTDHVQMKLNLNIIWLNPFIIICLITMILKKTGYVWFRIAFFISAAFLILQFVLPQEFNSAFFPLVLIILIRSSVRAGFEWNPITLT
jgi:hypothetical protein